MACLEPPESGASTEPTAAKSMRFSLQSHRVQELKQGILGPKNTNDSLHGNPDSSFYCCLDPWGVLTLPDLPFGCSLERRAVASL